MKNTLSNMIRNVKFAGRQGILLSAFAAISAGGAWAKSLYVIANINASPTPIQTYDIQGAPAHLVFQATQNVPSFAGGAVGLAIDNDNAKLFVTYEVSNVIQLLDATNFANLGTTTAPGASNLAGIVVDQGRDKVYTVDRSTDNLFVYSFDNATNTLTLDRGSSVDMQGISSAAVGGAHGIAIDESRDLLYVGDLTQQVKVYDLNDVNNLAVSPIPLLGTVDVSASGQSVQAVAVDTVRNNLFTGNALTAAFGSDAIGRLVKVDLDTSGVSYFDVRALLGSPTDTVVGVAVDEDTGNVYVTTGNQASGGSDTLIAFDASLGVLKSDIGVIGNPTGIAIPREDISFNPLNLTKSDSPDPVETGAELTYTVCFDNLNNMLPVANVTLVDQLPAETTFVSATGGGVYDSLAHTVTWNEGTLPAGAPQVCRELVVSVDAAADTTILNRVTIDSDDTPPTTQVEETSVIAVQVLYVAVDIKPNSCPNPLNQMSRGVIPVAILGSADFDVTMIDPTTIELAGVAPLRWSLEDVATPFEPFIGKEDPYACSTEGADGFDDLTLKFSNQEVVEAIEAMVGDLERGDVLVLEVTAELYDGTVIAGEDVMIVRK